MEGAPQPSVKRAMARAWFVASQASPSMLFMATAQPFNMAGRRRAKIACTKLVEEPKAKMPMMAVKLLSRITA